jgi:prepilin-type processing-associated H-X9-DG protein
LKLAAVFKCPADPRNVNYINPCHNTGPPTTRSYSVNGWMNPTPTTLAGGYLHPAGTYVVFKKQTDISRPTDIYITIEESPGTINDDWFVENPDRADQWTDMPASYHGKSCILLFADGHSETRKWTDSHVLNQEGNFVQRDPKSGDLPWLLNATTVRK